MFDATIQRAYTAEQSLKYAEALQYYSQALALQPNNSYALGHRGNVKLALGDAAGALSDFNLAIANDRQNAFALRGRGAAKQETSQDYEGSLSDFEASLKIEPNDAFALHNCAEMARRLKRLPQALNYINAAIKLAPSDSVFLEIRGMIEDDLGRYQDALASLDDSLSRNPQQINALNCRAGVKCKLRDFPGALNDYAASLAIKEDPEIREFYNRLQAAAQPLLQSAHLMSLTSQQPSSRHIEHDNFERQLSTIKHDLEKNINLHTLEVRYQALEKDALRLKRSDFFESRGDFYCKRTQSMHSRAAQRKPYCDAVIQYSMAFKYDGCNVTLNKKLHDAKAACETAAAPCREDLTVKGIAALERKKAELRARRGSAAQAPRELTLTDLTPAQRTTLEQMLVQLRQQSRVVSHSPPPPAVPARTYPRSTTAAITRMPAPTLRAAPPAGTPVPAPAPASTSRAASLSTPYAKLQTASGKTVTVWHATPTNPATSPEASKNFEEAMENFHRQEFGLAIANFKLAGIANPEVQYYIGLCHVELSKKNDAIKTTNIKEAIRWLEKAAKQKHSLASAKLVNLRITHPELV